MDKIAVLIPCYNEEKTIAKVVSDVKKFLPEAVTYVYDNNSTDRTVELATEAGAIIRHEYAQGKGNVIRRMFREIDAECYLMIDGDDTYPLDCAREMVAKVLEHQADMVVGDRLSSTYFTENKRPFHNFGNSLMRAGINGLFHSDIKDIMTGYRAFSYEFVKTFPVFSKGFEIETEMTIHAVNYNMQVENVWSVLSGIWSRHAGIFAGSGVGDIVCSGIFGVSEYGTGAEIPDADRLRIHSAGGDPVVFLRYDAGSYGGQGPEGFRVSSEPCAWGTSGT